MNRGRWRKSILTTELQAQRREVHENGVVLLTALPLESFLFTAAYDGKLKAFDALSAQLIFEASNPSARGEAQPGPPRRREREHNCFRLPEDPAT